MLYCVSWVVLMAIPVPGRIPAWLFLAWQAYVSVPMIAYIGLVLATTVSLNPLKWAYTAAGVVATHITYGVQFIRGLLAEKAPCEFIGKDHV